MTLPGEGQFNLSILKEIAVTDSFLGLDSDVIKCKRYYIEDSHDSCMTRYIWEQMRQNCKCLPFGINNATVIKDKVCRTYKKNST